MYTCIYVSVFPSKLPTFDLGNLVFCPLYNFQGMFCTGTNGDKFDIQPKSRAQKDEPHATLLV